ncbi:DUF5906 domain-containing protein [Alloyangia pacifica]|uniref:DUF5906 domain-containing protein n=1 Tax=Alloyangia pacifica TaxID=311180 RepID=UPI001CD5594D|nr:DUF5906 domain-containing protein [Alloyangia pacifica]MCA0997958.1 DUF5906 domain-containing protein [Alloyangia pacifica]
MKELASLYGQMPNGFLSVCAPRNGSFEVIQFYSVQDLERMEALMKELSREQTIYFGFNVLGTPPKNGRGTAGDFIAAPGVFLDIDLKQLDEGIHKANGKLPETLDQVLDLLSDETLPLPTQVLSSGNGLYFRYLFDRPYRFETEAERIVFQKRSKQFHRRFAQAFAKRGWTLDNMSDLPRVTRMAGTVNHKTVPAKPVSMLKYEEGNRYTIEWFDDFTAETVAPVRANRGRSTDLTVSGRRTDVESDKVDAKTMCLGCAWLRLAYEERADLTYPEWLATAGLLKHCKDGEQIFHDWSSTDPRYDEHEASALFEGIEGPTTCAYIADTSGAGICSTCPARINPHVGSPINFGRVTEPYLAGVLGRFVYVNQREIFKDLATGREYTKQNFNDHYVRYFKLPASTALASKLLTQVTTTAYLPGEQERFVNTFERGMVLNTWTRSDLMPVPGDTSVIEEHLAYLIPEVVEREHFLDVLAHIVQKPGKKICHCILLVGGQGTGKSWCTNLIEALVGRHNTAKVDSDTLGSTFNARMGDKQVLFLEELGLDDRAEAYNRLKMWITEPAVSVEEKHQPRYEAQTPRLMLGFSNRAVPIKIEGDDRRFMFIQTPKSPLDQAYYTRLFGQGLEQAAAFLHLLLHRDISSFSAKARPPMTSLKAEVVNASRPVVEVEVGEMIRNSEAPFDMELFQLSELRWKVRERVNSRANTSYNELGRVLRTHGYEQIGAQIRYKGRPYRLWARSSSEWLTAAPDVVREYLASNPSV